MTTIPLATLDQVFTEAQLQPSYSGLTRPIVSFPHQSPFDPHKTLFAHCKQRKEPADSRDEIRADKIIPGLFVPCRDDDDFP